MNEFEPKQFGKYYLLEKLAVGGMAEIYKAKTFGVDGFEKELAIKRILPHCSADKDFITMLIDEAKLSVMLSHANIVQVYDLGKVGDDYFISMEFIHGVNLRDIMYRCREDKVTTPPDIAVFIASEICKGLDYAHRKTDQHNQPLNIVHRDISPQNVLLSYEGEVKIVDFGIAKAAMNISHTMAGILKGKIAYMSPEQAMGKAIDRRTDIFSAGILLYEMITGTKLYTGESQFEVLKKIRTMRVTAEGLPDSIPAALKGTIARALAFSVDGRFQHAGDLQVELTKFLYSTYSDFSPRRLASFISEVFAGELGKEQIEKAREAALEQQTSSMSVGEGAKQMEIVHRETSFGPREATARAKGTREVFMETVVAPERRGETKPPQEAPTESRTMRKGRRWLLGSIALALLLGLSGFIAYRYVPSLRFWEKPATPVPAQLPATAGSARLTTNPPGARVFLDGRQMGEPTPAIIENLAIGSTYAFRFEREGFKSVERKVTIASAAPLDITLDLPAETGTLNIITDPPGAAIMVEGKLTGLTTPAAVEDIPLGRDLRITLSKPDYEDFEQAVSLTSPKPQRLSTKLKPIIPQSGRMSITSNPPGASVILNGKDIGRTTPATIANLEPQKYSVTLAMQGYESWSGSFDVAADSTVPLEATLNKTAAPAVTEPPAKAAQEPPAETPPVAGKAALKVTSSPDGARISLNGASTGRKTPASFDDLKIGASYNIRFDLEGYKSVTRKKAIQKQSETLYAALTKEEEKPATPEPPKTEPPGMEPPKVEPAKAETPPAKAETPPAKAEGGAGSIRIASNPSGADVFINQEHKGRTPLTVSVPSGTVSVLVGKEGAGKFSRQVTVKPGQTVNLTDINLGDIYGEVSLSSDPPRAQVIFDGQAIPAPTPVTVRRVRRDQQHTVTIQLSGYKSWSRTFSMDEGNKSFNATLQPQ